jgi:hypothetical protein
LSQGLFKLLEEKVFIRCLQRDASMIKGMLGDITKQFKKLIKEELGEEPKLELVVDESKFLHLREVPDFSKCKFEEFTEELERKIKIEKKDEMMKW